MDIPQLPERTLLYAKWIFPVSAPPIEQGTLVVEEGRIVDLFPRRDSTAIDLGPVGILPALFNTHAHLEFSHLTEPLQPPQPFAAWIRSLMTERRSRTVTLRESLTFGCDEATRTGTGVIGEIVTSEIIPDDVPAGTDTDSPGLHLIGFRELIAPTAARVADQLQLALDWLKNQSPSPVSGTEWLIRGLSPHASYTVHPDLLRGVCELIRQQPVPVAMHLAETTEELELLQKGTGPLAEMLQGVGAWEAGLFPGWGMSEILETLAECPQVLVVHGNYLRDDDIDWLAEHPNFTVVYCPRTHAFFGHQPHPWRELQQRGIRVALGTDGRGSNPDLDLWGEVRFLAHAFPDVPLTEILTMATHSGAEALGIESRCGSIQPGKKAQLAIAMSTNPDAADPDLWLRGVRQCTPYPW